MVLRREGHAVNRKPVYRLYKEERLMVRRRDGRKRAIGGSLADAAAAQAEPALVLRLRA